MKAVTMFEADDGSTWRSEVTAKARDAQVAAAKAAMAPLGGEYKVAGNCDFANGAGYIQHKPEDVLRAKIALIEASKPLLPSGWVERQTLPLHEIDPSWFHRFIDDGGPLTRAWSRFSCIDAQAREWGQPYFADNPTKGDQFAIQR